MLITNSTDKDIYNVIVGMVSICHVAYHHLRDQALNQHYQKNLNLITNTAQQSIHTQQTTQLEEMSTCLLTHVQD